MKMNMTSMLRNFIIIEHFFFINRSYLISDVKIWFFCNLVFVTITSSALCAIIFDIVYPEVNTHVAFRTVQIMTALETLHLALAARSKKSFPILDMIDEKFLDFNLQLDKLKNPVCTEISYFLIATLLDGLGFFIVDVTPSMFFSVFFGTAAHDAEMIFYTLIIKRISSRLSMLDKLDPVFGAKIYGTILIGCANLGAEFSIRVLVMLFAVFLKTVTYLVLFILSNYKITQLAVYFAFRELKAVYSVWMLCSAAAESDSAYQRLTFHLSSKLVMDPRINKYPKSPQYNAVSRWLSILNESRPKYVTGSILSINMAVPLLTIDLGISYMLIIVQIYTAFF